ncbi:hypothetical protein UAJ10_22795 [Nitrospirillum sp. BR 11164]|uniref:hypothetical protein n=1 Tax=Nitrospirillum sp. BR 11164 TaxID=3104324 RepID=UPI002AFDEED5|nr:hypothetical protein [Nitrospirillum sp. BR 11164]MEA1651829.1 hypothetical protein [Nitrospirillum sp. BR 11164]
MTGIPTAAPHTVTGDTLAAFKAAQGQRLAGDDLAKSTFTQSGSPTSGLTFYDLEPGAKLLYPVLTPLRNSIPRVSGRGGIQANWKAITGVNTTGVRAGVSGGNRGGVIAVRTQDMNAVYRGLGLEASVDFEADYAAEGLDDVRALAVQNLLESLMIQEEQMILGGNASVALGTTATPVVTAANSGGALTAGTWSIIAVGLTLEGYLNGSVTGGIQGQMTRTNADGSSDQFGGGAAKPSTAATGTTTGSAGSLAATVAPLAGAVAYAWFWGAAGAEKLGAITTINSVVITDLAAGTQTAASLGGGDNSQNSLSFDGLLYQAFKGGSNAYVQVMPTGAAGTGTPLTADGAGGIVEIETALKAFWDNYRLSPQEIWVSSQEAQTISRKILTGNTNSAQRFVFNTDQALLGGGVMVRTYLNRYSMVGGQTLDIKVHPNMPAGTILFRTTRLPYPLANVTNVTQMRMRRDYYQIEWPLRTRRYEYGVYCDGVLQNYFPPAFGVITNIANG